MHIETREKNGSKKYYLAHIAYAHPLKLKKIYVEAPCTECNIFKACGGRCLYANITHRWSKEAYAAVCDTVKELVNAVNMQLPRIDELIKDGKVRLSDFEFMKYNGCEIIP